MSLTKSISLHIKIQYPHGSINQLDKVISVDTWNKIQSLLQQEDKSDYFGNLITKEKQ